MMPTIFCDNDGCMFSDGCGFCDCDKLSIVGGVCEGSMHGGRNASDGDIDERLKAENAKLREFANMFAKVADVVGCDPCPYCNPDLCDEEIDPMKDGCRLYDELRELGIEAE